MSHLILIRGLPGSGKSTLAKKLIPIINANHFEADMFFINFEGKYIYDASRIREAHNWCFNKTRDALAMGQNVIVSNTFVRRWEMVPYLNLRPDAVILECSGNYQNVHGVPEEVIARMKQNWENQ